MSINRLDVQAICDTIGIDTSLIPEFIKTAGFKDGVTIAITTSSTGRYAFTCELQPKQRPPEEGQSSLVPRLFFPVYFHVCRIIQRKVVLRN